MAHDMHRYTMTAVDMLLVHHPGRVTLLGRSCCSWHSHAGREWIEGRGARAEVQSARAYTDMQHLTTGNASPSERAAES